MKFIEMMRLGCSDFQSEIWPMMLDEDELDYNEFVKVRKNKESWTSFLVEHGIPEDKYYFPIMSVKQNSKRPYFSISTICVYTEWNNRFLFKWDTLKLYQCLSGNRLTDYPGFKNAFSNRCFLGYREKDRQHIQIDTREYCSAVFHVDVEKIPMLPLGLLTIPT